MDNRQQWLKECSKCGSQFVEWIDECDGHKNIPSYCQGWHCVGCMEKRIK